MSDGWLSEVFSLDVTPRRKRKPAAVGSAAAIEVLRRAFDDRRDYYEFEEGSTRFRYVQTSMAVWRLQTLSANGSLWLEMQEVDANTLLGGFTKGLSERLFLRIDSSRGLFSVLPAPQQLTASRPAQTWRGNAQ
jgi:hypothetical protein